MNSLPQLHVTSPDHSQPVRGLAAGLIGGMVGSLAMVAFQGVWSWATGSPTRPAEHDVAGDAANPGADPSTVRGARVMARPFLNRELGATEGQVAGQIFHFAFGAGLGAAYGGLVEYVPLAAIGSGVPFGVLQTLAADEFSVPALGLSEPPRHAPPAEHLRALLAHVVYAVVTEQVRRRIRARL